MRRSSLAYAPGSSALHLAAPAAGMAFCGSFAVAAFIFDSPLVLIAVALAVALAGFAAGAGRAVLGTLRFSAPLVLLMVIVNGLVYHRGETVLVRGWRLPVIGDTDVTLESLASGGVVGLRIVVVLVAFGVYSACVDPDRVIRLLRPVARRSALTAALVARLIPVAAADASRLREAAALRGPGATPVGRGALARKLVSGSLDRAIDLAATLELRGHSLPGPAVWAGSPRGRQDPLLFACALTVSGGAVAGRLAGAGGFEAYPSLSMDSGPLTLALCALACAVALAPFTLASVRRGRASRRGAFGVRGRGPHPSGSASGA